MRAWLAPVVGSALTLAVAIGCTAADPMPVPTASPLPPTPSPTATPTLSVVREWDLDDVTVDGSSVTVLLRVYAGIDVWVTLDGKPAGDVGFAPPTLRSVFYDVAPGQHVIEVRDVVGHSETTGVTVVAPSTPEL